MASFGKFSLVVVVAGLAAASVSAQTAKKPSKTVIVSLPAAAGCPVGMQAQHSPGFTAEVPVGKSGGTGGAAHRGIGQHLRLRLSNSKPATIEAVRMTVHGWKAQGRAVPAAGNEAGADALRTVEVRVNLAPNATAAMDVWVDGLTAVTSIDLTGVTYADGSKWMTPATEACRIVPDPEMLISRR